MAAESGLVAEGYAEARALAERAALPALCGNVFAGTAGWTDKSLLTPGLFYPKGTSTAAARLEHYARHFPLVEVDATYYSLLPAEMSERWIRSTPASFQFHIKAFPVFTGHRIDVQKLPRDLRQALEQHDPQAFLSADDLPAELRGELERRFVEFLGPLVGAGRLARVMLQFPPWFAATKGNARRIEELAQRLPVPLAVEFRNRTWLESGRRERVFSLLREHKVAYVAVDEPDTRNGGVPDVVAVTDPELALVRLHGRNAAAWSKRSSVAERFNYLYREAELGGWVPRVRQLAQDASAVHVVFNNCVRDYAVLNAKGLIALLAQ